MKHMSYKTVVVKTHYSRTYLESQKENLIKEIKNLSELKRVEIIILWRSNIENDLKIGIWPFNGQLNNEQEFNINVSSKIKEILGKKFILSVELN